MWIFILKFRFLDVDVFYLINNVNFYFIKEGINVIFCGKVFIVLLSYFIGMVDVFCFFGNEKSENLVLKKSDFY